MAMHLYIDVYEEAVVLLVFYSLSAAAVEKDACHILLRMETANP